MFKITKNLKLTDDIFWIDVLAPRLAKSAKPGQFIIVKGNETAERIPLTIAGYDEEAGTVSIVIQTIGDGTKKLVNYQVGDSYLDFVGPLGIETEFMHEDLETLKNKKIMFIAGGLGTAPVLPQVKWLGENGVKVDVIIGARNKDLIILEDEMKKYAENVYVCTDDGSYGFNGNVTMLLKDLIDNQNKEYTEVVAIGPMIMMKFVCLTTKEYNIPTIVSMNPIMVDGTGMCGACRLTVGDEIKFACIDGPEFDGHLVDFDEAMRRQTLYKTEEGRAQLNAETPEPKHAENCSWPHELLDDGKVEEVEFDKKKRVKMREQDPKVRATNFAEVALGYNLEEAKLEASRCLECKNPRCVGACPVSIDIPGFIGKIKSGDIEASLEIISEATSLPAICGRVCPQESQCEGVCVVGIKSEPVAIGRLERYLGDYAIENNIRAGINVPPNNKKVAVIGAGPAGLACAGDLAKYGYTVKMFEALNEAGGVLVYGIPEFRLPKKDVVAHEIKNVENLGIDIETNVVIGKTVTIDQLFEEGYEAVFVGSGGGLPAFMGIPGENANGVFSANEYLTRSNLMKAFRDDHDTPIKIGKKVAVIGGGNVAMDVARTALRLGSEVHIVYRRSEAELPARLEEIHHAKEEGVIFDFLTAPTEVLVDDNGWVKGMNCIQMELEEDPASGRRRPVPKKDSDFEMDVDTVILALGTSPNTLITSTTEGLDVNKWGCVVVNEETLETSRDGVFAGGDVVTGAATVILAMGAGRKAAKGMHEYIQAKTK